MNSEMENISCHFKGKLRYADFSKNLELAGVVNNVRQRDKKDPRNSKEMNEKNIP